MIVLFLSSGVVILSGKHDDLTIWRTKFGIKLHKKKTKKIL